MRAEKQGGEREGTAGNTEYRFGETLGLGSGFLSENHEQRNSRGCRMVVKGVVV